MNAAGVILPRAREISQWPEACLRRFVTEEEE